MAISKDEQRIYDIRTKGGTDRFHMQRLATTQANRITDIPKCRRRYEAALSILGPEHPVTVAFRSRYDSLRGVVRDSFNEAIDLSDSLQKTLKEKEKIKAELKLKDGKVTGKIVSGKAENSVEDYIAFFRK